MLACHCPSKNYRDMNVSLSSGIGGAMFTALEQFAKTTSHPELAASKAILLGFSEGGSLVARMVGYAPDRLIAAIPYAPGNGEPLGINTVELPAEALTIPQRSFRFTRKNLRDCRNSGSRTGRSSPACSSSLVAHDESAATPSPETTAWFLVCSNRAAYPPCDPPSDFHAASGADSIFCVRRPASERNCLSKAILSQIKS
jgi:hypothetical protein